MQKPDPDTVSDIIDSLRAVGLDLDNAGLAQMAEVLRALALAGPEVWRDVEGLMADPEALAAYLRDRQGQEPLAKGADISAPDPRG